MHPFVHAGEVLSSSPLLHDESHCTMATSDATYMRAFNAACCISMEKRR